MAATTTSSEDIANISDSNITQNILNVKSLKEIITAIEERIGTLYSLGNGCWDGSYDSVSDITESIVILEKVLRNANELLLQLTAEEDSE